MRHSLYQRNIGNILFEISIFRWKQYSSPLNYQSITEDYTNQLYKNMYVYALPAFCCHRIMNVDAAAGYGY